MRLILASASPRRLDLLARIGVMPDAVVPADIDESIPEASCRASMPQRLAREKAEAVAAREPDALVLAADTVVAVGPPHPAQGRGRSRRCAPACDCCRAAATAC